MNQTAEDVTLFSDNDPQLMGSCKIPASIPLFTPRVVNAYFAKKVVVDGNVSFKKINSGILGRDIYIIIETENFNFPIESVTSPENKNLIVSLKTGDSNLTGVIDTTIYITNGSADVENFSVQIGNTDILQSGHLSPLLYSNLDDFTDFAILKVSMRPNSSNVFDNWAERIEASAQKQTAIEIQIDSEDKNMEIVYGPEGNTQEAPLKIGRFANTENHLFTIENKNVYEIFHADNRYNTYHGRRGNNRIAAIKNKSSKEAIYYFYNRIDNCYEICECDLSQTRRRNDGRTVTTTHFNTIYNNHTRTAPAPGGDADTNYYYSDGSIITYGTRYGYRRYSLASNDPNDLVDLIRMPDHLNIDKENGDNRVRATFSYRNTARRYCNPACFAGFLGMLIQLNRDDVVCTGMCFSDATSYPSVSHPNGDSADTAYLSKQAYEQKKVNGFRDHYFTNILRGNKSWYPKLANTSFGSGHNDHLHAGDFSENRVLLIN